jgi:apolipoprotein N-acyltransferase
MRAVEQGLPMVRVGNTGISAVIDAHGRVRASLGLGERGVIDAGLPVALAAATPYGRFGDAVPLALAALLGALAACWSVRRPGRAIM